MSRRLLIVAGVATWATLSLSACWTQPAQPPGGYEANDQVCADGIDNDRDGMTDCEDPHCVLKSTLCGESVPTVPYLEPEGSFETCHDFIDNDDNGNFDCGDPACNSVPENCCSREYTDARCANGVDDDQNGYTDCEDFGCSQGIFVTVCDLEGEQDVLCGDGKDNDGDGKVDCLDEGCSGFEACISDENTEDACKDGIDNDNDGNTDCRDPSCNTYNPADPSLGASQAAVMFCDALPQEAGVDLCKDGLDNDHDGLTDCDELLCNDYAQGADQQSVEHCMQFQEFQLDTCSDGVDNDGNGYTDCEDFSCSRVSSTVSNQEAVLYCQEQAGESVDEVTLELCQDGVDNDNNGYTDCADFSCSGAPTVMSYCAEVLENTFEKCRDGIDNDGNGYRDCDDYSCRRASDIEVARACQESLGLTDAEMNARCQDGVDNDEDGYTDCADWDCSHNPAVSTDACKDAPKVCE